MSYQVVSTSDVFGNIEKDLEALIHRVNALAAEGYRPVGGIVVRNNPESGDYFLQAMFNPDLPDEGSASLVRKLMSKKPGKR